MIKDCLRYQHIDRMIMLKQVFGVVTDLYQFRRDLPIGLYSDGFIKQQIS
jgi:hypothetical protein